MVIARGALVDVIIAAAEHHVLGALRVAVTFGLGLGASLDRAITDGSRQAAASPSFRRS